MGVTKNKTIHYKVFKELDLKKLMNYLVETADEVVKDKEYNRLSFKIFYDDNTSIDNSNADVLDETKLIESVHFNLVNFYQDINLEVVLKKNGGHMSVRGQDRNWVDAKFSQMEALIQAVPNQNKWLSSYISQVIIGNLISMPLILIISYFFLVPTIDELTVNIFFGISLHVLFSSFAILRLSKTYTSIEFDTSLEHLNKNKQRKKNVKYLTGTYLFPVVLVIIQYFT